MDNILSMISLGSGSSGNCYYIYNNDTGIFIDCGINTKQIFTRLEKLKIINPKINGVFITHEHHDHLAGCAVLERRENKEQNNYPTFYMTKGTYHSGNTKCMPKKVETIIAGQQIKIGSLIVEAFQVPHDGIETVCYRVGYKDHWVGVITDLGHINDSVLDKMRSLSIMALEFNYDPKMLTEGDYHWRLKERILSDYGHLSNSQAAFALQKTVSPRLHHLILSHISEANNQPQLARKAAIQALERAGHNDIVNIHVAEQYDPSLICTITDQESNVELV
jgi:phosphoribosyl 1,2-cyclic phosphodiesterase